MLLPQYIKRFNMLIVYTENAEYAKEAAGLAAHIGVPFVNGTDSDLRNADPKNPVHVKTDRSESDSFLSGMDNPEDTLMLQVDADGLTLKKGNLSMQGDFTHMLPRLKHNNLSHELLIKAAKIKNISDRPIRVLDATAGMGEDSLLLAAGGFEVRLYEYDPVIAALLKDTLRRSADIPELAEAVGRMELIEGDSIAAMRDNNFQPDVIFLDPMFPAREKSSLIKKKFQLLQQLEKPCEEGTGEKFLEAAFAAHPHKIVIKRPLKGPYLAGHKPDYSLPGKAIRYDCIICNS